MVVAVLGCVDTLPVGLVVLPLPDVLLTLLILPQPVPLHRSVLEVPHVVLFSKRQQSSPMGSIIGKIPNKGRTVGELGKSLAHLMVETEGALVEGMRGNKDPQSVAESIVDRSKVEGFLGGQELVVGLREELFLGEEVLGEEVILGVDALWDKGGGGDLVIGLGA